MNKKLRIATGISAAALLATTVMPVYQLKGRSDFTNLFGLLGTAPWVIAIPLLCVAIIVLSLKWRGKLSLVAPMLLAAVLLGMLIANSLTNEQATTPEPYTSFTLLSVLFAAGVGVAWIPAMLKHRKRGSELTKSFEKKFSKMDAKRFEKRHKQAQGAAARWLIIAGVFMFPLEIYLNGQSTGPDPTLRLFLALVMWSSAIYLYRRKPEQRQVTILSIVLTCLAIVPMLSVFQNGGGSDFEYIYIGVSIVACLMPIVATNYAKHMDVYKAKTK